MGITLQPDLDGPQGALAFLKHWSAEPLIFASRTDADTGAKGAFEARQFRSPVNWDEVRNWIAARQRDGSWANIYFSVNDALGSINKKLSRADVAALVALHVDVDIEPGEDQSAGIARIVNVFQHYKHPPTDIVTSGGGAQAFWRLAQPVPINGDVAIAEDLKLYNRQIERDLAGDHCHSLDHIMRVPGTVNIPNEIKLAKGRKPRLAAWHSTSAATYALGQFDKAEPEALIVPKGFDAAGFSFRTVLPSDEKLAKLDAKWLKLGLEGDTENKFMGADGKTDRSRMALAFVTAAKRAKVDDETIASVLMDVAWKVGECIRDKGGETKRQLKRIMERGGKFIDEDMDKPAVLGDDTWMKTAGQFIIRRWPDLVHYNGDYYPYRKGVYVPTEEDTVRSAVRKFLNESLKFAGTDEATGKPKFMPFNPLNNDVNETMGALKDTVHLDRDACEQPAWLNGSEGRPPPTECINCQNGILHVPTRTLLEHTPDFFTSNISEFAYEPAATCPTWGNTLDQYWPRVDGAVAPEVLLLQEIFGYLILPWTNLQKIFAIVGPGRSGKGTIGRVLRMLVGEKNVAAPTLGSLGRGDFGLQPLLHKTLAIVGEAAFGRGDDRSAATNVLKTISGEDKVEVNRKNKEHWLGRLLVRFILFCNKIPDFEDAGKALMMRLIPLQMTVSWSGKEDELLGDKLEAEIAGIMNWALEGFDRLVHNDGKFTMPASSLATREVFGRMASPVQTFLDDTCIMNPKCHVSEEDLFKTYEFWCSKNGTHARPRPKFIQDIVASDPAQLKQARPRLDNDGREYKTRPNSITGLLLKQALVPETRRDLAGDQIPF